MALNTKVFMPVRDFPSYEEVGKKVRLLRLPSGQTIMQGFTYEGREVGELLWGNRTPKETERLLGRIRRFLAHVEASSYPLSVYRGILVKSGTSPYLGHQAPPLWALHDRFFAEAIPPGKEVVIVRGKLRKVKDVDWVPTLYLALDHAISTQRSQPFQVMIKQKRLPELSSLSSPVKRLR